MSLVEEANNAYFNAEDGKPIITDKEFDLLAENGLDIQNFRNKTEHFQPMGSLKKIKEEEDFAKWRPEGAEIKITPKLDGNSVEIVVVDGKFACGITRGDGFVGNDISDKIQHCNIIHTVVPGEKHYSIKCEAIMKKEYQSEYDKNLRNVVGGILNRKTVVIEDLQKIDIIPFMDLDCLQTHELSYTEMAEQYETKKMSFPYEIDGLVVELVNKVHAEKSDLLPENIIAVKFNKEGVDAEVGEIEWNLGKHGKLTPVIKLRHSVEIDGTNVQRVNASNWSLLIEAGLGIGAEIQVIKSGDIIPYVSKVVKKSGLIYNPICPVCGSLGELNDTKVNMLCKNHLCEGKKLIAIQHMFQVFDLDYISESTVKNLFDGGVKTIEDFFNLTTEAICAIPGFGAGKANNIVNRLKSVSLSHADILKCAMIPGISNSTGQKLINHFGNIENFLTSRMKECIEKLNGQDQTYYLHEDYDYDKIDHIGDVLSKAINDNMFEFNRIYEILLKYVTIKPEVVVDFETGRSVNKNINIVFTGKCDQFSRKELTDVLETAGYTVQKSINKLTNILLVADVNSNSSKTKKAKTLGVEIKAYENFFKENKIESK